MRNLRNKFLKKHFQKGISLLEVLLSLTIIAIILVMATRYFFLATNYDRVNNTRAQIGEAVQAITNWKNQNPLFSADLDLTMLYNAGFIPNTSSLVADQPPPDAKTVTLYNSWGDQITVAGATDHAVVSSQLPTDNDCLSLKNGYADATCDGKGGFTLDVY